MLIEIIAQSDAKRPGFVPTVGVLVVMGPLMMRRLWRAWAREEKFWGGLFGYLLFVLFFVYLAIVARADR